MSRPFLSALTENASNTGKVQLRAEKVCADASALATACVLCSQNCGLLVDVADNRIVKVKADKNSPITAGYSCNKAYSIDHHVHHQQRVKQPLKRQANGQYQAISWQQAVTEIAQQLNDIRAKQGAQAIALCGLGGQANHMDAFYGLSFLQALGSSWFFNSYAQEKTQHQWVDWLMMKSPVSAWYHPDAWNSDYLLMMGTNPLLSNRHENAKENLHRFLSEKHRRLVVVDPRVTETARRAHRHLRLKPAGDAFLLLAMIKIILDETWFDARALQAQSKNFDALQTLFKTLDVHSLAQQCGLDVDEIREVSEGFSKANSACVFYDLGVEQIEHSTLVSWLIRVLVLVTGNFARRGGQYIISNFIPYDQRAVPSVMPKAPVSGIEGIAALTTTPMFSPYLMPEEIEAGNIRALIVEGANPLLSYGDSRRYKKALQSLQLLVVIDPAMTETGRVADYVLPTPVGYEKWEYCTFPRGFPDIKFQLRPPVVSGPVEALPEAEIYYRLAKAMHLVPQAPKLLQYLGKKTSGNRAFYAITLMCSAFIGARGDSNKITSFAAFWNYEALGRSLKSPTLSSVWLSCLGFALLQRKDMLRVLGKKFRWSTPFRMAGETFQRIMANPQGVVVASLDRDDNFSHAVRTGDKKIDLLPDAIRPLFNRAMDAFNNEADANDGSTEGNQYPLLLCAGERTAWNANTLHRSPHWRKGKGPYFWIKINPVTAQALELEDGEQVKLVTPQGDISGPIKITDTVFPGVLSAPNGFGIEYLDTASGELTKVGENLNQLTSLEQRDPITGIPYLKHQRCRLEKFKNDRGSQ